MPHYSQSFGIKPFLDGHVFDYGDGTIRIVLVSNEVHNGMGWTEITVSVRDSDYTDVRTFAATLANDMMVSYEIARTEDWLPARLYVHPHNGKSYDSQVYLGNLIEWSRRNNRV